MKNKISIIPLGGLEEIGKNMMAIGYMDEYVIIDAGMAFPDEGMLGVQCIVPNFDFIKENKSKIKAVLLTHAHEDHIGAIPYLLNEVDIPIYGTALTVGILKNKLKHHKPKYKPELKVIDPSDFRMEMTGMFIECFRTIHSIYDSVAYVFKTEVGNVVHMGDFKLDFSPIDGRGYNYDYLVELSKTGVDLLISDSTNAFKTGISNTELNVAKELKKEMSKAEGLTVVSTFSSSLPRIQSIINIAEKLNKKIIFAGVSMLNNVKVAIKLGNIRVNKDSIDTIKNIDKYPREKVVLVTTGAQGESMAGLMKLATDSNEHLKLKKNDTIIFSSGVVPGNERSVMNLVNKLLKKEVTIVRKEEIHTSGHGHSSDLKMMIDMLRPKYVLPFHGEYSMLLEHKNLAMECGIKENNVLLCNNNDIIEIGGDSYSIIKGNKDRSPHMIDHTEKAYVTDVVSRDRAIMSKSGVAVVNINIKDQKNEFVHVSVKLKGVAVKADMTKISIEIKELFVNEYLKKGKLNKTIANNYDVINDISKVFSRQAKIRPMIIPFINF